MTQKKIEFTAVVTGPVEGYWLTVDGDGVLMDGITHMGTSLLASGAHSLQYFLRGASGSIAISGVDTTSNIVVVTANGSIIAGKRYGFGNKDFLVL